MFRFPHAVGPALRRPRVLGPRVGGVCEHRVGLPTLYFTLCRTLNTLSYSPQPSTDAPRVLRQLIATAAKPSGEKSSR